MSVVDPEWSRGLVKVGTRYVQTTVQTQGRSVSFGDTLPRSRFRRDPVGLVRDTTPERILTSEEGTQPHGDDPQCHFLSGLSGV